MRDLIKSFYLPENKLEIFGGIQQRNLPGTLWLTEGAVARATVGVCPLEKTVSIAYTTQDLTLNWMGWVGGNFSEFGCETPQPPTLVSW